MNAPLHTRLHPSTRIPKCVAAMAEIRARGTADPCHQRLLADLVDELCTIAREHPGSAEDARLALKQFADGAA